MRARACPLLQVAAGESCIIPSGWPHALLAQEDCLLAGSLWLSVTSVRMQVHWLNGLGFFRVGF